MGFIGGVNGSTGYGEYETGDIAIAEVPCGDTYCDTNPNNSASVSVSTCFCAAKSIDVRLAGATPNQFAYLLVSVTSGLITDPPGAVGDLCLSGTIGRYVLDVGKTDAAGAYETDILNALSGGGGGGVPMIGGKLCDPPGQTWNFQYWYRDGMNPARFSTAVTVLFQ